ncbi:hypothetical protein PHAVU_002G165900 [Phaseolus vulgaris]|uniref:Small ribosomal subunit protein uS2c n=1 Tax=Phaseolus vulgaris TaxID=3885 RepID=V7CMV6_PHAVU|nr:hypothetical protein PHAVU_002G165900g [Phaseolus vulgaris]ESW30590.1 hypothetical protein PHAVU_002G165900g [Phaseolus vulgaris]
MSPYISTKRKGIHITNLIRTVQFLSESCDLVFHVASGAKQFLIVGTRKRAVDSVLRAAIRARCHYVNKKWLGGMLTNWCTTKTRLQNFRNLRMQQKMGRFDCFPKKDVAILKTQSLSLQKRLMKN